MIYRHLLLYSYDEDSHDMFREAQLHFVAVGAMDVWTSIIALITWRLIPVIYPVHNKSHQYREIWYAKAIERHLVINKPVKISLSNFHRFLSVVYVVQALVFPHIGCRVYHNDVACYNMICTSFVMGKGVITNWLLTINYRKLINPSS